MPIKLGTLTVTSLLLGATAISSALLGSVPLYGGTAAFTKYGVQPYFVMDTPKNKYLTSGPEVSDNLSGLMTSVALGNATVIDKAAVPVNIVTESTPTTAGWVVETAATISDTAGGLRIQSGGNAWDRSQNEAGGLLAGAQYTWYLEYTAGTSSNARFNVYETGLNLNVHGPVGAMVIVVATGVTGASVVNRALGAGKYSVTVVATASVTVGNGVGFGPSTETVGKDIYLTKATCYRTEHGALKWRLHNLLHDSIPTVAAWSAVGGATLSDEASGLEVTSDGSDLDAANVSADEFEDLARYTWVTEYTVGTSAGFLFRVADSSPGTIDLRVGGAVGAAASITSTNVSDVVIVNTALGGGSYRLEVSATLATGGVINNGPRFGPNTNTAGETVFITKAWSYRSDLGGMQLSSKDGTDYLPTAGAAGYALRRDYSRDTVNGEILGEPAGVNGLRNNTMQGAAVGVVSGAGALPDNWLIAGVSSDDIEVVAVGVEDGASYIDIKFDGTPTGNPQVFFETTSGIAGTVGELWSTSMWCQIVAGDLTNVDSAFLLQQEFDSSSAFLSQDNGLAVSLTGARQRFSASFDIDDATAAYVRSGFRLAWTSGAIDITLRIYMPQMEEYHVATSVIPTYGASEARAKDEASCVIADKIPGFIQGSGSIVFEGSVDYETGGSTFPAAVRIDNGGDSSQIPVFFAESTGSAFLNVTTAGVGQANVGNVSVASGEVFRSAGRWDANDIAFSADGSAAGQDTSGTIDSNMTHIRLGDDSGVQRPIRISHLSIGPYASPVSTPGWSNAQLAVISGS
jgi:hypothetical protein